MIFRAIVLFLLLTVAFTRVDATDDITMRIRFNKATYKIGARMRLQFVYHNSAKHAIRFLPEPEPRYADALLLTEVNSKRPGIVIPFGEMSMDFEGLSKRVVLLRPGQEYSRRFVLQIASTLPPSYKESRKGLFLWFPGSTIELPHSGRYCAIGQYYCSPKHPVARYLSGKPRLWYGEAKSAPVIVEFR